MAEQLPDNSKLPTVNRPETILGVIITFLVLAYVAISLRLYVRLKQGLWGWDDMFVFLAGASHTVGTALTCLMPDSGMGKHFWTLDPPTVMRYFKYIWATNITYTASTTFIKLSILFQYLRLFDMQSKAARSVTWVMIGLTAAWGTTFFLLALFSCRPIAKNWNFSLPGTCVAWGSKNPDIFFATWASHAASNMLFDILVLVLPIPFLKGLRMQGRTRIGLITLFAMGGIVAMLSLARMVALSIRRAGTVPIFDPSYATPAIYIFSDLEINIGIMIASIPIFWPLVTSLAANKILIVNEVEIRTERRHSQNMGLAEQGANIPGCGIPELELEMDKGGRTSRMSVLMTTAVNGKDSNGPGKLARSASKLTRSSSRLHKSKHSTSSSNKDIELTSSVARISHESQQNLNLTSKTSHSALSYSSAQSYMDRGRADGNGNEDGNEMDPTRNGSVTHYQDRYVQDWVVPTNVGGGGTYTTTVERAEIPFDHIKALEK